MSIGQPSFEKFSDDLSGDLMATIRSNGELETLLNEVIKDIHARDDSFSTAEGFGDLEGSKQKLKEAVMEKLQLTEKEADDLLEDIVKREEDHRQEPAYREAA